MYDLERLNKAKDDLERLIREYKPINNFINTNQTPSKDYVEWRILNETEEVDNLYVQNKTLFINDNLMVLKGVDGSLQKWEIKKTYPIDKKDQRINELEEEIKKLKEMITNESTKSNGSTRKRNKSNADDDGDVESNTETSSESVSRKE